MEDKWASWGPAKKKKKLFVCVSEGPYSSFRLNHVPFHLLVGGPPSDWVDACGTRNGAKRNRRDQSLRHLLCACVLGKRGAPDFFASVGGCPGFFGFREAGLTFAFAIRFILEKRAGLKGTKLGVCCEWLWRVLAVFWKRQSAFFRPRRGIDIRSFKGVFS